MDTADDYQRQHAQWMDARAVGLTDEEEGEWAEKLDLIWRKLPAPEQAKADAWVKAQSAYRQEHDLTHEDLTPGERAYIEYAGEYELILAENEHSVVFQVNGRDLELSRGELLDYDEEGRFFLSVADAKRHGLAN